MASKLLRRATTLLGSLAVLAAALGALFYWQEQRRLDRSLSVLIEKLWGVRVSTEARVTAWSLFESEGNWLLNWEERAGASQTRFLVDGMSIADTSDHGYYGSKVTDVLSLRFPLESYVLFRGEFPLGDGQNDSIRGSRYEVLF